MAIKQLYRGGDACLFLDIYIEDDETLCIVAEAGENEIGGPLHRIERRIPVQGVA